MKGIYLTLLGAVLLLSSCSKQVLVPENTDPDQFMRTHERGAVAYVDYGSGNYIMETRNGYSVIEAWSGITPREYEIQYGYFSSRGTQTIYNYDRNYFTQGRVVDSWLSWSEALYVLDGLSYHSYSTP